MEIGGTLSLITGASSGIGAATARALARAGSSTLLVARDEAKLASVAESITSQGGKAEVFSADLSRIEEIERLAAWLKEKGHRPDILINSAGAGRWLSIEETPPAEVIEMMAAPYYAAFWTTQKVMGAMMDRRRGHIVNMVSPSYWVGLVGAAGYSAARWAMAAFDQSLAEEMRGTGVKVTLCCPGVTKTPYFETNDHAERRVPWIVKLYPKVTPEQVADAIVGAIRTGKRAIYMPFLIRLTYWAWRAFPWPVEWALQRTGWKPNRG